jgi:L-alanine-DL-glutamate epimerase-like enolase superfamily enzyme
VLTRRQEFAPWIERQCVDIIQPDVTKCGGLTEEHRIAMHAHEHGVLFVPHGWNTAVGLAADLQLVAAVPVAVRAHRHTDRQTDRQTDVMQQCHVTLVESALESSPLRGACVAVCMHACVQRWVEFITPAPYIEELVEGTPFALVDGALAIPSAPGLGVCWSDAAIERFSGGLRLSDQVLGVVPPPTRASAPA